MDITRVRKAKGMTLAVLAAKTGISESYLCCIETGKRRPSVNAAKKLADVLGLDWPSLFDDVGGR